MERNTDPWAESDEGQLSVDVVETPTHLVIRSAIAGVSPDDLDIAVTGDTVTIRGKRGPLCEEKSDETVHVQECFWGSFSRSVILPCRIRTEETDAVIKNGVLTVTLPKAEMRASIRVTEEPGA
jgi:HSP20 family protein